MSSNEGPSAGRGKWGDRAVPKHGWECVGIDDLGEPSATCEMCEKQEIRFVHEMQHPRFPDVLKCGCICAGHMEGDLDRATRRDKRMRASARRRQAWPDRAGWKVSSKGNPTIQAGGYRVTIFPKAGQFAAALVRVDGGKKRFSRNTYATVRAAQLASFDAIAFFQDIDG